MKVRASAGWIDYLVAFLIPYVILILSIGNEEFHFRFFMDRTLHSASHHIAFLFFGLLYFSIVEGIWGAGLGKRLKGLRIVRKNGQPPGIGRALIRILIQILCIEGVRIPLLMALISAAAINDLTWREILAYSTATTLCPLIPILMIFSARRKNKFATIWDLASGTRVVMKPEGVVRPLLSPAVQLNLRTESADSIGPYKIIKILIPGEWIVAIDPVLRRQVWLLRRKSSELSLARRNLARPGRLRWLQKVEAAESTWDAFEAPRGKSFLSLVEGGKRASWGTLRHWLHDLASELWNSESDQILPSELGLDCVWITEQGRAVLLDQPWPEIEFPVERISVTDVATQQRFLNGVAAYVDLTTLPLHARGVLENLKDEKFEKLSFLAGILSGLLTKPTKVSTAIRAGSIFLLPLYIWIMIFVGVHQGAEWLHEIVGGSVAWLALSTTMFVLVGAALMQLLVLPLRTTASHSIFRLAVINAMGKPADRSKLLIRWAIVWLPLLLPVFILGMSINEIGRAAAFYTNLGLLLIWLSGAIYAVVHPNRGIQDRLAGTWVVRR